MKTELLYGLFVIIFLLAVSSENRDTRRTGASIQSCQVIDNHIGIVPETSGCPEKPVPPLHFFRFSNKNILGNKLVNVLSLSATNLRLEQSDLNYSLPLPHTLRLLYTSETDDTHHLA